MQGLKGCCTLSDLPAPCTFASAQPLTFPFPSIPTREAEHLVSLWETEYLASCPAARGMGKQFLCGWGSPHFLGPGNHQTSPCCTSLSLDASLPKWSGELLGSLQPRFQWHCCHHRPHRALWLAQCSPGMPFGFPATCLLPNLCHQAPCAAEPCPG